MKNKTPIPLRAFLLSILLTTAGMLFAQSSTSQDSVAFYLKQAQADKLNGRRIDLLKNLDKALAFQSRDPRVLRELGSFLAELRKCQQAMDKLTEAVSLAPQDSSLLRQTMELAYQLRQYDQVIRLASGIQSSSMNPCMALLLGKVYYDQENYGSAISYLMQAGKGNSISAEIPYLLAKSYADMTNYKAAIPFFQQALSLDPKQPYWAYELGLSYNAIHDNPNALKYIQLAGTLGYRQDNDYMENLATAYLNVGSFDEGIRILKDALVRRPADFNLLNMLAEAHYSSGKYTIAMEYWDKLLEYDKTNASALYMIGMCYQKMGGKQNTDKGTALCDKAIQMDPTLAGLKQKRMLEGF